MTCQQSLWPTPPIKHVLTPFLTPVSDGVTSGRKNPLFLGFPGRLRRLRAAEAYSLKELSVAAGCSDAILSKIENESVRTSLAIVEGLAASLNVSPTYLAYGHEGFLPFRQKRPVPATAPEDPVAGGLLTTGGIRDRHQGVAERVRSARETRGHTIRGLAALAGLSAQAVLYTENGERAPKIDTCEQLAAALDVAPGWLAFGEGRGDD